MNQQTTVIARQEAASVSMTIPGTGLFPHKTHAALDCRTPSAYEQQRWLKVMFCCLLFVLAVALLSVTQSAYAASSSGGDNTNGAPFDKGAATLGLKGQYEGHDIQRCALCHSGYVKNFLAHSPMAQASNPGSPMAVGGKGHVCEVCHGPSHNHVNNAKHPPPPVSFGMKNLGQMRWKEKPGQAATPVKQQNAVCMDCHNDAQHIHWAGSPHQFNHVSCAGCHNAMGKDKTANKRTVATVCFQCHTNIRADAHKRVSHPILEGEVTCTDCHNPHGGNGGPHQLKHMTINQTCYSCHAAKRGPFLFEHPPVEEKCTNCHNPHGTSFNDMLKRPVPFLCQECHLAPYHPTNVYGPNKLAGTGAGASQLVGRGCLDCHSHIHGSNSPDGGRWLR